MHQQRHMPPVHWVKNYNVQVCRCAGRASGAGLSVQQATIMSYWSMCHDAHVYPDCQAPERSRVRCTMQLLRCGTYIEYRRLQLLLVKRTVLLCLATCVACICLQAAHLAECAPCTAASPEPGSHHQRASQAAGKLRHTTQQNSSPGEASAASFVQ
jgi:hypothetical protein